MNECSVLWCGKFRQNNETDLHNHTFFQMMGFSEGNGQVLIENQSFPITPKQVYLLRPQLQHAVVAAPGSPLRILDIKFSVQSQPLFEDLCHIETPFTPESFSWITHSFETIIHESQKREDYYYSLICNTLLEMLVHIIREQGGGGRPRQAPLTETPKAKTYKGVDVAALMDYIQFNYSHIISLDDLSHAACVNKTTLSNMFKELYNTTPIRYINGIRMQKALELLANTDLGIGEIAELVGFQSIHYFSRYFKEKMDCTPIEYRMRSSQNRFFYYS